REPGLLGLFGVRDLPEPRFRDAALPAYLGGPGVLQFLQACLPTGKRIRGGLRVPCRDAHALIGCPAGRTVARLAAQSPYVAPPREFAVGEVLRRGKLAVRIRLGSLKPRDTIRLRLDLRACLGGTDIDLAQALAFLLKLGDGLMRLRARLGVLAQLAVDARR